MSDEPKLKELLQNAWPASVKIIEVTEKSQKNWEDWRRPTWKLYRKDDSGLRHFDSKDSIGRVNETLMASDDFW